MLHPLLMAFKFLFWCRGSSWKYDRICRPIAKAWPCERRPPLGRDERVWSKSFRFVMAGLLFLLACGFVPASEGRLAPFRRIAGTDSGRVVAGRGTG